MIELTEKLKKLSTSVQAKIQHLLTEEATKTALVMPFFQLLGYDVFNPQEFVPEIVADVGLKKGEKVDYAIMQDGLPVIIIECKSCNSTLENNQESQLFRYFATNMGSKFAILTNGIIYKFFTDLENKNVMDLKPFLEFSILDLKKHQIVEIAKFQKTSLDIDAISSSASDLRYMNSIRNVFKGLIEDPSDQFVRLLMDDVYVGKKTASSVEQFKALSKRAMSQYLNDIVNDRMQDALTEINRSNEAKRIKDEEEAPMQVSNIVTTDFEIECFQVIRAIACERVDPERITLKDNQTYCAVLVDNKVTRWIARIYETATKLQIAIPLPEKQQEVIDLVSASSIYHLKDKILDALAMYI